jgi:lipooligosaccharide transport system permease protein
MPDRLTTLLPTPRHVGLLLVRYWYEYRQLWKTQIFRDLLDRLLYLFAFGFGFGGLMAASHGGNYLAFLVPGIAASNMVFVMTLAMTFGAWERFSSTKVWQAWLATPIRLPDILLAELLYAAGRSMPSIVILFVLALLMGALPSPLGALLALPVLILAGLALGAIALCFCAHIKRTLQFAYVNTLWTTPMFLFSGVFFDPHHAPLPLQLFSSLLPLTHVIRIVRPLMLGQPLDPLTAAFDLLALAILFAAAYLYAAHKFKQRLLS